MRQHVCACCCCAGEGEEAIAAAVARRRFELTLATIGISQACSRSTYGPKMFDSAPFSWKDHVERLDEKQFQLRYRLSAAAFYDLLRMVGDKIDVQNHEKAVHSKGTCALVPLSMPSAA